MTHALGFRPRLARIDELLLLAARARNPDVAELDHALREPAMSLFELFPGAPGVPAHFGKVSRSISTLVYQVIVPADTGRVSPPGLEAKGVQVADIYESSTGGMPRTTYLVLWFAQEEPILVLCPEITDVLLHPAGRHFLADSRDALHELLWQMTERLNIIAPAARALARPDR